MYTSVHSATLTGTVVPLEAGDTGLGFDLTDRDINHILDMWAEDRPAFIGELEFRPADDAGA